MPKLRPDAMSLVEAIEYIRNDEAYVAALAHLQEVREVLEGLRQASNPACWCYDTWDSETEPHSPTCQRTQRLMAQLRVDGAS